jgi:hypothetical protein
VTGLLGGRGKLRSRCASSGGRAGGQARSPSSVTAPPQPARVKRVREQKRRDGKPRRSALDLADEREDDKQDLSDEHQELATHLEEPKAVRAATTSRAWNVILFRRVARSSAPSQTRHRAPRAPARATGEPARVRGATVLRRNGRGPTHIVPGLGPGTVVCTDGKPVVP